MSLRRFTAPQALAVLLAAVCLPFLAVAKPPGLPVQTKVECKPQAVETTTGSVLFGVGVNTDAGVVGAIVLSERLEYCPILGLFLMKRDLAEDFVGTFCPGFGDTLESCWRTLTRWVPVRCAPNCFAEPTTRLAVIEILPVMPKLVKDDCPLMTALSTFGMRPVIRSSDPVQLITPRIIINEEEEEKFLRQNRPAAPKPVDQSLLADIMTAATRSQVFAQAPKPANQGPYREIPFADPTVPWPVGDLETGGYFIAFGSRYVNWSFPRATERIEVVPTPVGEPSETSPMPALRELPAFEFMCLPEDNWERMPTAHEKCQSCGQHTAPRQIVVTDCTDLACCVLENLARLEKAHQLVEKAKRCCQEGKFVEACHCYQAAAKLCPGSRYSMLCRAWMHEMMTQCAPGGVIQASATEPAVTKEKSSAWPKIEIKLTIEVKKQ